MRKPEILAPAGSMESLKAAIEAGADAVYMGGSRFGARAYAENPDRDHLLEAISYVHLHGKRLYLTVNTLIKEQEFSELYEFLAPSYAAGLDAAIVQDFGALEFISKEFPGLAIHASTQMTLTAPGALSLLRDYPVTRVVPARELSLTEVKNLCDNTALEVEIFVHGALCYCYSGQCLMSSLIGGRSGNRGRCAQPCRMEYTAPNKNAGFYLSPKDQCGLSILPQILETGAASLKIEGRMKKPEYAAITAAAYRRFTDLYESLGAQGYRDYLKENPQALEQSISELADIYNRGGFSTGCFQRRNGPQLMSMKRPGHFGTKVGTVTADQTGEAGILLERSVNAQDVLEFRAKAGAAEGIPAYYEYTLKDGKEKGATIRARLMPKQKAKKGDVVYRMKNAALLEQIRTKYLQNERKPLVQGYFYAKAGEPCTLTLQTEVEPILQASAFFEGDPVPVSICQSGFVCEKAGKLPATKDAVQKQLCKTGNEMFGFDHLEIELADDVFLPNGLLNELRRNAFAALYQSICAQYERKLPDACARKDACGMADAADSPVRSMEGEVPTDCLVRTQVPMDCTVLTVEQAKAAADTTVRRIYLESTVSVDAARELIATLHQKNKQLYLSLPRIMRADTRKRWEVRLRELDPLVDGYLVRNPESVDLLMKSGISMENRIVLDHNVYTMNSHAKQFWNRSLGEVEYTAPFELSSRELATLGLSDMTLVVYGRIPLMVTVHCVQNNLEGCVRRENTGGAKEKISTAADLSLTDRVGKQILVKRCCEECYNVFYNPEILNLLSDWEEIQTLKPQAIRLDFTFETPEEVRELLQNGVSHSPGGKGYTRGHFKRGVE